MKDLNHIGINNEYLPVNLFNNLKKEIDNLRGKVGYQSNLAGNIKEEWSLATVIPVLNNYIVNLINKHSSHLRTLQIERKKFVNENKVPQLQLISLWVNFQKKHEFNPIHNHHGLFSFVIFVQIPYDLKKELTEGPGSSSNSNYTSCLQFHVTNPLGKHHDEVVYVDKSYEGGIYFFNAETMHCVYPFFTSDDYRITVSGNVGWV